MSFLRHPVTSVAQSTPRHRSHAAGFTLLEAQIAVLIFVVAMVGMIGSGRVYKRLLTSVESQNRVDGVALAAGRRAIATVTHAGSGTGDPSCDVRLHDVTEDAGTVEADVYVTRRSP